jgi:replicative DNA helicase
MAVRPSLAEGGSPGDSPPPFERVPPHNIEAEESVLGSMLLSKDAIAEVLELLSEEDFYRPAHRTVFRTVLELYSRGQAVDAVTVAEHLRRDGVLQDIGGAPFLFTLVSGVPTAANSGYYARIVKEAGTLRRLIDVGTRIVQLGFETPQDTERAVDLAESLVYQVAQGRVSEDYQSLREVLTGTLEAIERLHDDRREITGIPTGFPELDRLTSGLQNSNLVIVAARPAVGKALALDTPLPTPTGWTTMGEVAVGDELLGADGRPTTVVAATDVMQGRPCYEVEFSDGTVIVADAQHQWLTDTRASRKSVWAAARQYDRTRTRRTLPSVKTTEEILATLHCSGTERRLNHAVASTRPLDLPAQDLPLPPYVLGAWLGDGHANSARITTADPEIVVYLEADGLRVVPRGGLLYSLQLPERPPVELRSCVVCGESSGLAQCQECRNHHGTVQGILRGLGVLGSKHIPARYLRASEAQRRALVAGLLDTDGTVTNGGAVQFVVTSRRLAEDIRELIVSLGYRCSMTRKRVKGRTEASSMAYTLTFSTTDEVFRLERKRLVHKERKGPGRTARRFITDVRPVASVPVRCVEVDGPDHRYLASRSMVPTHNSTLGLDFARHAAVRGQVPTVVFSLEMSKTELVQRLMCAECSVDMQRLRTGRMEESDWTRLTRSLGKLAEAPLFIDDSASVTMMEIRAKCRRLKQRHGLGLVIVDYLQLMQPAKRFDNRQQEVSEISRSLKLLAKELEVPVVAISQLSRQPESRSDRRPLLSDLRESGCLTADTRVTRADTGAEVSLGELLARGERDIPVWALDDDLRLVRGTMTHVFPSGIKPVFELRLASGRHVKASANHPFLTLGGWRPLAELAVGDRLATPRTIPEPSGFTVWADSEVVMLAHLLGDGCFVSRQPIHYTSADPANLEAVEQAAAHFGITPRRVAQNNWWHVYLPAPFRLTHGKRNPIAAWLDRFGLYGLRSYEKFIPAEVFRLPSSQIALFVRHLWATDGSVRLDSQQGRIFYASSSRRLVDDLQSLLLRLGIRGRIKRVQKASYRPGYHLYLYGAENQLRFLSLVGIHGARGAALEPLEAFLRTVLSKANTNLDTIPKEIWAAVRRRMREVGVTARALQAAIGTQYCGSTLYKTAPGRALAKVALALDDDRMSRLAASDVFWDSVVAIQPLGDQPVYDASVPDTHNFIADGIIVHNSLEQDADVVLFIYRDELYDRETERKGEADLILAKHRNGPTDTVVVTFQGQYSRFFPMAPRSM